MIRCFAMPIQSFTFETMKSVCIIRHAKSSWEDQDLPDVIRPLNKRGKKTSGLVGRYLAQLHEKPDLIISSPATRAYHTAVNIAQILGYRMKNIVIDPIIYFEGEQGIINMLRRLDDKYDHIFIIGHEPTLSDVIETLSGETVSKFPTTAVFKINLDMTSWKDIYESKGKKVFFTIPKQIRE